MTKLRTQSGGKNLINQQLIKLRKQYHYSQRHLACLLQLAGYDIDKNIITRAIGAKDTVEVDFFQVELHPGDIVLMCSDGLTNMLEDREIHMILSSQGSVEEKAEELVKAANLNGGKDNIAVIVMEPFVSAGNEPALS